MKILSILFAAALVLNCVSCQSAGKGAQPGNVEHTVLVWLKNPSDSAARQKIIDATKTFKEIPGVIDARAGRAVPSTQPTVDATFDVGIVVTFKDRASLAAYGPHPIHAKAARELIVPVMKAVKAYDVELE